MELTFTREDIPKINRAGGSGREAEPWEIHLAPAKETPGISFRVWTYEKRTGAVSRMSTVRERLTKAVPAENWKLAVRPITVKVTNDDGNEQDAEHYGVYVQYDGQYTPEQIAENARLHQERSERVKASRAAAEAGRLKDDASTNGDTPSTESPVSESATASEPTPQERVKAARAKAKA